MDTFAVEEIAAFTLRAAGGDLEPAVRERLKLSVLDALGCAIGALGGEPVGRVREQVELFGGRGLCRLIGGGASAPDRATLVNGCLIRYLDFMDNCASPGEVCHPSDNLAALLATAEFAGRSGSELLVALAISYQVQCRLMAGLPTMRAGVNYTTPLAYSVAAGAGVLLELGPSQTANALALAGVGSVSLAVIQAEPVSQWKGLASGEVASRALHNVFLASRGITGDLGVFEGPFGLEHLVGDRLSVDWAKERLDAPLGVSIKRYNAEFQSQSSIDAAVELHQGLDASAIREVVIDVAKGAYDVLGGGSYGQKEDCHNKEQADHNLKYLVSVALLDGDVQVEQFATDRINRGDVQELLRKVTVRPNDEFTRGIPNAMACRVQITLMDGEMLTAERRDYPGFHTRPMSWAEVRAKFDRLAEPFMDSTLRDEIAGAVADFERTPVSELMGLLARRADRSDLTGVRL
jgi:2-methylcitrate dehydratase